jgi:erythromycin esterase
MRLRLLPCLGILSLASGLVTAQVHRLNWSAPYDSGGLAFLKSNLVNRSVVQLGESIHLTDEFPRVRLPLVRYLHEEMGFDVLALEGSAVDSWIAQDHLYRSADPLHRKALEAQRLAWFGLWQTEAMNEVMKYVATTQDSQSPLYLTSFDSQPGSSNAFRSDGLKSLGAFFEAVEAYAPAPDSDAFDRWKSAFRPFVSNCYQATKARSDDERKAMDQSLAELSAWLRTASLRVHPAIHARALFAVIASLHATFELCGIAPAHPFGGQSYQRVRDRENALTTMAIKNNVSASGKIILWAHHSHISHGSIGSDVPSLGRSLLEMLGSQLYTIGLFAESGEGISSADGDRLGHRSLRPASDFEIEDALGQLADFDYFLDLASPDLPAVLRRVSTARFETTDVTRYVLVRDFSAVIVIQKVHPPVLTLARVQR